MDDSVGNMVYGVLRKGWGDKINLRKSVIVCLDFQIPSSAVEMPGSADVSGLNVQFGALDFASEAAVERTGQFETSSQEPAPPLTQTQSNLYSKSSTVW